MTNFGRLGGVLVMGIVLAGCVTRQPVAPAQGVAPKPEATATLPAEVAAEFSRSTAAYNNGDLETFLSIYADDATLAQKESFLTGKSAIRTLYGERFGAGMVRDNLHIERLDVTELSPGIVLVRGLYRTAREGAVTWRGTMTVLMRPVDGKWRIFHDHSN